MARRSPRHFLCLAGREKGFFYSFNVEIERPARLFAQVRSNVVLEHAGSFLDKDGVSCGKANCV
jgi:hypothetical protein